MPNLDPVSVTALICAIIAAVVASWSAWLNRNEARRARREPTWVNLNDRVSVLEEDARGHSRQMSAVSRILHAIAAQWPDSEGPDLRPEDMKLIEQHVPPLWIRARRPGR